MSFLGMGWRRTGTLHKWLGKASFKEATSANTEMMRKKQPDDNLREACPTQRDEYMQRPWEKNKNSTFKGLNED